MNTPMKVLAEVMPSRWAFEDLLLLETAERPKWTPPPTVPLSATKAEKPKEQDTGPSNTFPRATSVWERVRSRDCIMHMLVLLVGTTFGSLKSRDVH